MTDHDGAADYVAEAEEAPATQPLSAMAIASFALGLIALPAVAVPAVAWILSILAVVFGHTGRREIKQGLKSGWGYDLGGLIIGYLVLTGLVLSLLARR